MPRAASTCAKPCNKSTAWGIKFDEEQVVVDASGIKFDEEQVVVDASGIKFVEVGHPPFQAGLGDHPIVAVGIQPDHQLLRQAEERL